MHKRTPKTEERVSAVQPTAAACARGGPVVPAFVTWRARPAARPRARRCMGGGGLTGRQVGGRWGKERGRAKTVGAQARTAATGSAPRERAAEGWALAASGKAAQAGRALKRRSTAGRHLKPPLFRSPSSRNKTSSAVAVVHHRGPIFICPQPTPLHARGAWFPSGDFPHRAPSVCPRSFRGAYRSRTWAASGLAGRLRLWRGAGERPVRGWRSRADRAWGARGGDLAQLGQGARRSDWRDDDQTTTFTTITRVCKNHE